MVSLRNFGWALGLLGAVGAASCSSTGVDTDEEAATQVGTTASALHASNEDATTQLFNVGHPNGDFPLLASGGRGYRLECATHDGLRKLIEGAGFDLALQPLGSPIDINSGQFNALVGKEFVAREDFAVLPCAFTPANGAFIAVDFDGEKKYFLNLLERDESHKVILHNVGCAELLSAMGLDLRAALPLDRTLAEHDYAIDDAYDIHCVAGTKPSEFAPRLTASPASQEVDRGRAIGVVTFALENVPSGATATIVPISDDCGFLTLDGMTVSGRVDAAFANGRCSATYVARGATFETAPVTVTFSLGCAIGSVDNCGACGEVCRAPRNATATCVRQTCGKLCKAGFGDCNRDAADGCEVPLTSLTSCGSCGRACTGGPNTIPSCATGKCVAPCKAGYADCNGKAADGCETKLDSTSNCGRCGVVCAGAPNAVAACVNGTCQPQCTGAFRDCNSSRADGCEANVASVSNCGGCGNVCPKRANAVAVCTNGSCGATCKPGWAACNGNAADGCETNLELPTSCGACGKVCKVANGFENGVAVCDDGDCKTVCKPRFSDCNGDSSDGCEANLEFSRLNCGACGRKCPGGLHRCFLGKCVFGPPVLGGSHL